MIGKPEWFTRRKYGGWGLMPKTWQGWVYIAVIIIPIIIIQSLPFLDVVARSIITAIWALFLIVDVTIIMAKMKKDERERVHEAIAERNALWAIIMVLAIGLVYQIVTSSLQQKIAYDPLIIIALVIALAVKAISNIYLDRKD